MPKNSNLKPSLQKNSAAYTSAYEDGCYRATVAILNAKNTLPKTKITRFNTKNIAEIPKKYENNTKAWIDGYNFVVDQHLKMTSREKAAKSKAPKAEKKVKTPKAPKEPKPKKEPRVEKTVEEKRTEHTRYSGGRSAGLSAAGYAALKAKNEERPFVESDIAPMPPEKAKDELWAAGYNAVVKKAVRMAADGTLKLPKRAVPQKPHAPKRSRGRRDGTAAFIDAMRTALAKKIPFDIDAVKKAAPEHKDDDAYLTDYLAAVDEKYKEYQSGLLTLKPKRIKKTDKDETPSSEESKEFVKEGRDACDTAEKRAMRKAKKGGFTYYPTQIEIPEDTPTYNEHFVKGFYERKNELCKEWLDEHKKMHVVKPLPQAAPEPKIEPKAEPKTETKPAEPASPYSHGYVKPQKKTGGYGRFDPDSPPKPLTPPRHTQQQHQQPLATTNSDWYRIGYDLARRIPGKVNLSTIVPPEALLSADMDANNDFWEGATDAANGKPAKYERPLEKKPFNETSFDIKNRVNHKSPYKNRSEKEKADVQKNGYFDGRNALERAIRSGEEFNYEEIFPLGNLADDPDYSLGFSKGVKDRMKKHGDDEKARLEKEALEAKAREAKEIADFEQGLGPVPPKAKITADNEETEIAEIEKLQKEREALSKATAAEIREKRGEDLARRRYDSGYYYVINELRPVLRKMLQTDGNLDALDISFPDDMPEGSDKRRGGEAAWNYLIDMFGRYQRAVDKIGEHLMSMIMNDESIMQYHPSLPDDVKRDSALCDEIEKSIPNILNFYRSYQATRRTYYKRIVAVARNLEPGKKLPPFTPDYDPKRDPNRYKGAERAFKDMALEFEAGAQWADEEGPALIEDELEKSGFLDGWLFWPQMDENTLYFQGAIKRAGALVDERIKKSREEAPQKNDPYALVPKKFKGESKDFKDGFVYTIKIISAREIKSPDDLKKLPEEVKAASKDNRNFCRGCDDAVRHWKKEWLEAAHAQTETTLNDILNDAATNARS